MSNPNAEFQLPFTEAVTPELPQSEIDSVRQEIVQLENDFASALNVAVNRSPEHFERQRRALALGGDIESSRQSIIKGRIDANKSTSVKDILKDLLKGRVDPTLISFKAIDEVKLKDKIIRELLNAESDAAQLVLPEPTHDGRRLFFMSHHSSNEWIWHEEDASGNNVQVVRYIISDNDSVVRSFQHGPHEYVTPQEFNALMIAIERYHEAVMRGVYSRRSDYSLTA